MAIERTGRPGRPKGYPKSGGRKKKIPGQVERVLEALPAKGKSRITKKRVGEALMAEGITPLEFALLVMRDPERDWADRQWACSLAIGYCHPKLAAVDHSGQIDHHHETILDYLDTAQHLVSDHGNEPVSGPH